MKTVSTMNDVIWMILKVDYGKQEKVGTGVCYNTPKVQDIRIPPSLYTWSMKFWK
jgi:hypothetical protein